jgi:hypothetical protein
VIRRHCFLFFTFNLAQEFHLKENRRFPIVIDLFYSLPPNPRVIVSLTFTLMMMRMEATELWSLIVVSQLKCKINFSSSRDCAREANISAPKPSRSDLFAFPVSDELEQGALKVRVGFNSLLALSLSLSSDHFAMAALRCPFGSRI